MQSKLRAARGVILTGAFVALAHMSGATSAVAQGVVRTSLNADLKIIDPIWTTADPTLRHAYLIYDTLFSMDESMTPRPQMVDKHSISEDELTYTFTLRSGLEWHDGAPVRSADCVASLKRWMARDSLGQKLAEFTDTLEAVDDTTFRLKLKEKFGLVLEALAKIGANAPFMMPERIAKTDPAEQIKDPTGSGPFKMVLAEWKVGDRAVYVKNERYKPRSEPPSMFAGGKVPKLDRVELVFIPDTGTVISALKAGEIDYVPEPSFDLVPSLAKDAKIRIARQDPIGYQQWLRFNFLHPPFDNPKARQAVLAAMDQEEYMQAGIGNPEYYRTCAAVFMCGTPFETTAGAESFGKADLTKARQLLKESGYDGRRIVMLAQDWPFHRAAALVTVQQLRKIGFNVDVQSMDLSTFFQRRQITEAPDKGGWSLFHTDFPGANNTPALNIAINTRCDRKNWVGWPCNEEIERLRDTWMRTTDDSKKRQLLEQLQTKVYEFATHGITGQFYKLTAYSAKLEGVLETPVPVYWNMSKR